MILFLSVYYIVKSGIEEKVKLMLMKDGIVKEKL